MFLQNFNMCNLAYNFFLLFFSINFICIDFCYELIFINKFIKHNYVNGMYCNIKY
jgi:hypothetical protein